MKRRQIITYTAGLGVFGFGAWNWLNVDQGTPEEPEPYQYQVLTGPDRYLLFTLSVTLLDGYLQSVQNPQKVLWQVIHDVDESLARLSLDSQTQLRQLFNLLENGLLRLWFLQSFDTWSKVDAQVVERLLLDFRWSRFALLRSAYQGLQRLVLGAFFSRATYWQAIGYQ